MDLNEIERILELMREHEILEVELEDPEKGMRLKLKKAGPSPYPHPVLAPTVTALPYEMPVGAGGGGVSSPSTAAAPPPEAEPSNLEEVPSPMVGTFYRASSPDSEPFTEVGDTIDVDSVICIIEAMKVMNEIKAEVAGEVVEILVQNGEAVEFGQPLFLIRTG